MSQVQTKMGMRRSDMLGARMFMIVTMMLIAPMMDEIPIR